MPMNLTYSKHLQAGEVPKSIVGSYIRNLKRMGTLCLILITSTPIQQGPKMGKQYYEISIFTQSIVFYFIFSQIITEQECKTTFRTKLFYLHRGMYNYLAVRAFSFSSPYPHSEMTIVRICYIIQTITIKA